MLDETTRFMIGVNLVDGKKDHALRQWQLTHKSPFAIQLAADARLCQTDFKDDQSWQIVLGHGEDPAIALQTKYGGRVGLVSLVPMWRQESRTIYQAQAFHQPPVISAFAPGFVEVTGNILAGIEVIIRCWVAESHALYCHTTLKNHTSLPVSLRFDLFGHVVHREKEQPINLLTLREGGNALYLGTIGDIDPVVIVAGGHAEADPTGRIGPRVGVNLTVSANESTEVRWSHAALPDMVNSIRRAHYWLSQDWQHIHEQMALAARAIPEIETGNADWNATIASAFQQMMQSLIGPGEGLPNLSFVGNREPAHGFDEHLRTWNGQVPTTAYLIAPVLATIAPQIAEGLVRNYLAVQTDDGAIDWAPGLDGQRRGMLCLPMLAQTAWQVYEATGNRDFLVDVFPGLQRFFEHWLATDQDGDSIPEWQDIRQTGYTDWPLTKQGVDTRFVEAPDLLAYLASECRALIATAEALSHPTNELEAHQQELLSAFEYLWQQERFVYRDRDTHATPTGQMILKDGRPDEEHILALPLETPSRLVVQVQGGTSKTPRMSVHVQGLDLDGQELKETLDHSRFQWGYGKGAATTETVFSQIDRIDFDGLSRVYRVHVSATNLSALDINTLLPMWSGVISQEQAELLQTPFDALLYPNGVALYPTPDHPVADESGVWIYWNALIGEGLLRYGYPEKAADLLQRLLRVQTATLREKGRFTAFYDINDMRGIGTGSEISGVVPLHLLMQIIGVRIRPDGTVLTGGPFYWNDPVTVRQHGITVQRKDQETHITWATGETTSVPNQTEQRITPPAQQAPQTAHLNLSAQPEMIGSETGRPPVRIEVEIDD